MLQLVKDTSNEIEQFLKFIYGDQEGYVHLGFRDYEKFKDEKKRKFAWKNLYLQYPSELTKICSIIAEKSRLFDVYFGPSLCFEAGNGKKSNVKGSNVVWVELDSKAPEEGISEIPEPSIVVQSSDEDHQHLYWRLDEFIPSDRAEQINRSLSLAYRADLSGWDSTQVLRPPRTYNFKRERSSILLRLDENKVYSPSSFSDLPGFTTTVQPIEIPDELPPAEEVIWKYRLPGRVSNLFKKGKPEPHRSTALMELGYMLAELGMGNDEVLSVLVDADSRWGKFSGRNDQVSKLTQIVAIAREKYPLEEVQYSDKYRAYQFLDLLKTEISLEWCWEGFLETAGYMLVSGASGVGKTQFSLDFGINAVLAQPFLDRKITRPFKVGFLSLEMGLVEIKHFLENQTKYLSHAEQAQLQERFSIFPVGEPVYFNQQREQDSLEERIGDLNLEILIIDSLGAASEQDLRQGSDAKALMDWAQRIRQRHKCVTWIIHHHRKASSDNKKPNKLSDVYGDQIITARTTSVICLWDNDSSEDGFIDAIPLKVRLAEKPKPMRLYRDGNLRYTLRPDSGIVLTQKQNESTFEKGVESKKPEQKPTDPNKKFGFGKTQ
jgi:hypothetical protein